MNNLLIEIGTEEIPAGYIAPALKEFSKLLLNKLKENRIEHGIANTFGTPRRLSVIVLNVADKQQDIVTEITGPPERIGFDENGNPTIAAEKFAQKAGITVGKIKTKETRKGLYLYAEKKEKGILTKSILKQILPEVILSISFPKTMRWANFSVEFARPIISVLALLGKSVVQFKLGEIQSGRYAFGHPFMHSGKIKIISSEKYADQLRSVYVYIDIKERRTHIEKNIEKTISDIEGSVLPDSELLDIVTNLVEYPEVVIGRFDKKFLELPDEVLITSMREHQKYFSVIDKNNQLLPYFIAVNNTKATDMAVAAKGHEKVLRSRLEDAMFFFRSDSNITSETRINNLKKVLFQAKLGSVFQKVERVKGVAEYLADELNLDAKEKNMVSRSAWLCKSDLVSQVVVEFPKLQGVMGRFYALMEKEPDDVAVAIEEHYRPVRSGAALPATITGALLGISDKIDSICGCFSINMIPTGASDPYALRRQGIGIIQIILDKGFLFSLNDLLTKSLTLFNEKTGHDFPKTQDKIYSFLKDRMIHILNEDGYAKDTIAAVVEASADCIPDVWEKVKSLEKLRASADFEPIAAAFKRVVNIMKKSADIKSDKEHNVDENLFEHEFERALFSSYKNIAKKASASMNERNFDKALYDMAQLRNPVDAFFDNVLVMAENEALRNNRLTLLSNIAVFFGTFADFSKVST